MWNPILVRLETVLVSVQDRSMVCTERTIVSDWMHPMVLPGDKAHGKVLSVCLEIVVTLTHHRCTVCAKHSIGSEINLDAADGTPR
jgi:hypothetical protein